MKQQNGWVSLILFFLFLFMTDFFSGIRYLLEDTTTILEQIIRPSFQFDTLDLQKQLLIFNTYQTYANESEVDTTTGEPPKETSSNKKSVYIYSTHQTEKYNDGKTVVDASIRLAELLEEKGMNVIVELNDFSKYAKSNGYTYDDLYEVSRFYFQQAIEEYGEFDYVIDLHRDGVGNANTSIVQDGVSYAKMMFVVSLAGKHSDVQYTLASLMTKEMNINIKGIGKNINKKYYTIFNQDVLENVYLVEMGSNNNSFNEVEKTLEVFVEVLARR